jgi:PTS system mannose-specific IIA component
VDVIGIVVVGHGQLAVELVNAAAAIVGEIPRIEAVSVGWSDDVSDAHASVKSALERVGGAPALVLTDMFGGTPTNVSLPLLGEGVEIVTGVNLPMLIKLVGLREGELREVARVVRDQGKGAIYVASELLERKHA